MFVSIDPYKPTDTTITTNRRARDAQAYAQNGRAYHTASATGRKRKPNTFAAINTQLKCNRRIRALSLSARSSFWSFVITFKNATAHVEVITQPQLQKTFKLKKFQFQIKLDKEAEDVSSVNAFRW